MKLHATIDGLPPQELKQGLQMVQQQMENLVTKHELNAPVHNDLVLLKHLYVQCRHKLNSCS
ncbi:hypothetical protein THIOM_001702 [Candidatus Thiomargarita nelsonii]|uniref:Uncharacterized protein n=1 Tax=Candidatus Thiomargarita nelsonii TaxID=1003181 RepID=A0A176S3H7_9GAMM|nr:hypothetical protein THIOM_001702 [Candidatus Thiomargarita nelsonii]